MVRPLARQAWQSDADRIDSLERWSITAPLQADHLAELAELRAKTEAPIHGVAAPDVDEDFKTEPIANRTDTTIMAPTTDSSNALDHFDGLDQYEISLTEFTNRAAPAWMIEGAIAKHALFVIVVAEHLQKIRVTLHNLAAREDALETARQIQAGEYAGVTIDAEAHARELAPGQRILTLKFGHTARAETCDRPQCKDRGKSFREGDHNCEHELPGDIHDEGIGLFYDLDADQWAIDLEPAAAEYFTGGKAARIADALRRAGIICDSLNGVTIRRPIDYCAEPEFNGAGGGL